ncbi:MAG: HNH endonuclease [Chloroflexota bacterium]|nr:HNH endonuclease [Chloroflexota bacterium]MDE2962194.1 HNH endonuclease [Chloroflexota bacterium]
MQFVVSAPWYGVFAVGAIRGTDHIENLQLLCAHCNRVKGDRLQEYLVARLREMGMAA